MKPKAFLDACVLYPYSVRDILMQFAVDDFYQVKWSSKVEEEMVRNIEKNNPHLKGKLSKTVQLMRAAIPDYSANANTETIDKVKKSRTDVKDVEILAAAIDSECTHLVTANLKDFDTEFASRHGVQIIHPDRFLSELVDQNLKQSVESLATIVRRLKNPPRAKEDYCSALKKNGLVNLAKKLWSAAGNIIINGITLLFFTKSISFLWHN